MWNNPTRLEVKQTLQVLQKWSTELRRWAPSVRLSTWPTCRDVFKGPNASPVPTLSPLSHIEGLLFLVFKAFPSAVSPSLSVSALPSWTSSCRFTDTDTHKKMKKMLMTHTDIFNPFKTTFLLSWTHYNTDVDLRLWNWGRRKGCADLVQRLYLELW